MPIIYWDDWLIDHFIGSKLNYWLITWLNDWLIDWLFLQENGPTSAIIWAARMPAWFPGMWDVTNSPFTVKVRKWGSNVGLDWRCCNTLIEFFVYHKTGKGDFQCHSHQCFLSFSTVAELETHIKTHDRTIGMNWALTTKNQFMVPYRRYISHMGKYVYKDEINIDVNAFFTFQGIFRVNLKDADTKLWRRRI